MDRIRNYIKGKWPMKIIPIDPESNFINSLGQRNREFFLEVGFPTGIEMIMDGLAADFISIPVENFQIIHNNWRYLAIAGYYLNYGCPIGEDSVFLYADGASRPIFINSNIERMYYFIIKAYEAMLEDHEYTFEELKIEFITLESDYLDASCLSFWEVISSWQLGEEDFNLDSEGNMI